MAIANYNSKDLKSKYMEFIIDTPADILDLPGLEEAGIGSNALCLSDSSIYILSSSGEWVNI